MWHFLLPVNGFDLIQSVNVGRETPMDAKHFLVDQSSQREEIEYFSAVAPHIDRPVLAQTFVVKAVDLRDLAAFVVASDQRDVLWVPHLQCQ